ncbi:MAG: type II secretion system F family protein [Chloroflexi bacterium]|nr:type II secretion system F family protein [Chloroflexota bacterium]
MAESSALSKSAREYFEEISPFDLYYQLTYMSATAAAGVSRGKVFELARHLPCPPARFFKEIDETVANLRFNYPDAVHMVGERVKTEDVKTFLLRLSDALRSGEPLPGFLERESNVLGDSYGNDYETKLESLKKWTDAYTAVTVSSALIVIMIMVSTMIYSMNPAVMAGMITVAIGGAFAVAWVMLRTSPQEILDVPLAKGSQLQQRARKLSRALIPLGILVCAALIYFLNLDKGWALILFGAFCFPAGFVYARAQAKTEKKDREISDFLRSVGGAATSRGTTLKEAIATLRFDSFPTLKPDIHMLDLRLKAFGKPRLCWDLFGTETGSKLAEQATGVFTEAVGLGGDPERAGNLTSAFAMRTAMLRAKRRGVAATFAWLIIVMHAVMSALMVFLLGILNQFTVRMEAVMKGAGGTAALSTMGLGGMFQFNSAQIQFLSDLVVGMTVMLAFVNAFAVVAAEGSHLIKTLMYSAVLLIISGILILVGPSLVKLVI